MSCTFFRGRRALEGRPREVWTPLVLLPPTCLLGDEFGRDGSELLLLLLLK